MILVVNSRDCELVFANVRYREWTTATECATAVVGRTVRDVFKLQQ